MSELHLFDVPGASMRRKLVVFNVVGTVVTAAVIGFVLWKLAQAGQFDSALWLPFLEPGLWRTIGAGLAATLRAAVWCILLSLGVGTVLGVARLSTRPWIRWPVSLWVEFFRSVPPLLVVFFLFLTCSRWFDGVGLTLRAHSWSWLSSLVGFSDFKTVGPLVMAVVLQQSAIIGEVMRAGILAVPKGQSDAALALGMTEGRLLRTILLPQAVRGMLPTLISECVRSLKSTTLGYIIGYLDLLRTGQIIASALNNPIPTSFVVMMIYVALCLPISRLAEWLDARSNRILPLEPTVNLPAVDRTMAIRQMS